MRLWPLPRAVQLLIVLLLALISVAPSTAAGPLVPDVLAGSAPATTFQVFGNGYTFEGGAFDYTDVCSYCWIRMTITGGSITVTDPDHPTTSVRQLGPGQYELREYRGVFGLQIIGQRDFILWLEGSGKVEQIS